MVIGYGSTERIIVCHEESVVDVVSTVASAVLAGMRTGKVVHGERRHQFEICEPGVAAVDDFIQQAELGV